MTDYVSCLHALITAGVLVDDMTYRSRYMSRLGPDHEVFDLVRAVTSFLPDDASIPTRIYCIRHNVRHSPVCEQCGGTTITRLNRTTGFPRFCSTKCSNSNTDKKQSVRDANTAKYGGHPLSTPAVQEKRRHTNTERYGVPECVNAEVVKQKRAHTCIERYGAPTYVGSVVGQQVATTHNLATLGVPYRFQSAVVQEQVRTSVQTRYNVRSTACLPHVKQKALRSIVSRYASPDVYECMRDRDWLHDQHVTKKRTLTNIAHSLGLKDEKSISKQMSRCDIPITNFYGTSMGERQVCEFISSHIECTSSNRTVISPLELDIYIPSKNIAIEYCGLYWHGDGHKSPTYHQQKLAACQENGVRLITLFEDEWKAHPDIVKSKLLNIIGASTDRRIFARKCTVSAVSSVVKREFFSRYHIQGDGPSSVNYGLYADGVLVACIAFIKKSGGVFVLNRYATAASVLGGFTKLLSHFTQHHTWTKIETFADLRWSSGDLYDASGFALEYMISPDYYWTDGTTRWHKFGFRHKHLARKLAEYDPTLTEEQNCVNHGLWKIYDCGKKKYVLTAQRAQCTLVCDQHNNRC